MYSIAACSDVGYITAGCTTSTDGDDSGFHGSLGSDVLILKLDQYGNKQWVKALGGSYYETAHAIVESTDGGYVFTATTSSNDGNVEGNDGRIWSVKLDKVGALQWQKTFSGPDIGAPSSFITIGSPSAVTTSLEGGYVITGGSSARGRDDYEERWYFGKARVYETGSQWYAGLA